MAVPRVFVSSTCYDLGQIRDNLVSFIKSFYFQPVLSERGDVFYHPDLHTHECCISEIGNCDLFILIIGGRFGGDYISDIKKSIVNAEYMAARENDIPVFTFIKRDVFDDHKVYQKNKNNKGIIEKIVFPSIEKKEHSIKIFQFIDDVRHSKVNNGLFTFEFSKDIENMLGKQWSGMFCDFLSKRKYQKQFEVTTSLLGQLTLASQKTEEIVKNMYMHIDEKNAEQKIKEIDELDYARKFFEVFKQRVNIDKYAIDNIEKLTDIDEGTTWIDFVLKFDCIDILEGADILTMEGDDKVQDIILNYESNIGLTVGGDMSNSDKAAVKELENYYSYFISLNPEQRKKVVEKYVAINK